MSTVVDVLIVCMIHLKTIDIHMCTHMCTHLPHTPTHTQLPYALPTVGEFVTNATYVAPQSLR